MKAMRWAVLTLTVVSLNVQARTSSHTIAPEKLPQQGRVTVNADITRAVVDMRAAVAASPFFKLPANAPALKEIQTRLAEVDEITKKLGANPADAAALHARRATLMREVDEATTRAKLGAPTGWSNALASAKKTFTSTSAQGGLTGLIADLQGPRKKDAVKLPPTFVGTLRQMEANAALRGETVSAEAVAAINKAIPSIGATYKGLQATSQADADNFAKVLETKLLHGNDHKSEIERVMSAARPTADGKVNESGKVSLEVMGDISDAFREFYKVHLDKLLADNKLAKVDAVAEAKRLAAIDTEKYLMGEIENLPSGKKRGINKADEETRAKLCKENCLEGILACATPK